MGAKQKMTMRVTVERLRDTKDPYGHPGTAWGVYHSEIPCYVWETSDRKVIGTTMTTESSSIKMIVGKSVDITINDRVKSVIDRRGTELYGILLIDGPAVARKDHKELRLKRIA